MVVGRSAMTSQATGCSRSSWNTSIGFGSTLNLSNVVPESPMVSCT